MMAPEMTDVEVVVPPIKKARPSLISWNDKKKVDLMEQNYVNKLYLAKKKTEAFETVAAVLNAHCDEFKTVSISGANVKSRMESGVAEYVGTYFTDYAKKSGFDGDRDNEENYSDKKIHEEMEML